MRKFVKIRFRSRQKKPSGFKMRVFRFVSFAIILALGLSGLNFLAVGEHPKAKAQTFTTSGTWTVPAGVNTAIMEAWGGGGSGAGSSTNGTGGGGGAGGQYSKKTLAVNPGDIYTVTVATTTTGGTGGGTTGSDSLVTSPSSVVIVRAKGGAGGTLAGSGGAGSTTNGIGDTVFAGGTGANGSGVSATSGGGGGGGGSGGGGGNASGTSGGTGTATGGGNGGNAGSNANGSAGSVEGGGGGGASKSSGSSKSGGSGAAGQVIINSALVNNTIRQEINILDGTLAVSSTSNAIVQLNTAQYSGTVSYYFEVVTGSSSASTDTVTLTRKGTSTNDASISLAGTGANTRVRSSSFAPPSSTQTEYVVKSGANHTIKAARIIVVQTSKPMTYTETQIEIGDQETGLTNTNSSTAQLNSPKYWTYTSANWDGATSFYAEATKTQSSNQTQVTLVLEGDDGTFNNWGEVARIVNHDTTLTATRFRTSFIPINGRHYRLGSFETDNTKNYSIFNAKIIVSQGGLAQVGSDGADTSTIPALTGLSSSRVAAIVDTGTGATNMELRAYDFNGSTWSQVGSAFLIPTNTAFQYNPTLATLTSSRVAFIDSRNDQLTAYDFNGSTWSQVGSALTITGNGVPALAGLSSSRVAFVDSTNVQLRTYDFSGSTWSQTGSSLSVPAGVAGLAILSSSRVAYVNGSTTGAVRTYDFSGSSWSQTGNSLSIDLNNSVGVGPLTSTRIAVASTRLGNGGIVTFDFDGTNWSQSSNIANNPQLAASNAIAGLSSSRIALIGNTSHLRAYDMNGPITSLEPQYMLRNTVGAATGLQGYPTKWDSAEWTPLTSSFTHVIDSTNASSSAKLQDIDNANTDVTGSTATGNNQIFSSAMSMPTSGHQVDSNITASATTVTADRIDAVITLSAVASNSAPNSSTLTAPSSGATGVSTTPTFSFNASDTDSDDIQFKINLFQSDCSTTVSMTPSGDMASGQTGWTTTFNGSAGSGLSYTNSTSVSGVSFTPTAALTAGTTYCWSVSAIDPGGSNTTTTSSTQLFTTAAAGPTTDQVMRGGTYFSNGAKQPIYWAQ